MKIKNLVVTVLGVALIALLPTLSFAQQGNNFNPKQVNQIEKIIHN